VLLGNRRARAAFLGIYREVLDTATALGIRPEAIAMDPWRLYLPSNAGLLRRTLMDLLMRIVGLKYRNLKSSSLQSLERGRKTEVRYLNGHVVERAAQVGVPVPLNAALVRLIEEIEAGARPIAPANLDELVAAAR